MILHLEQGTHKNGDDVAVKRLYYDLKDEQFKELRNHMRLDHPNIVRVVGYCDETQHEQVDYDGKFVLAEVRYRALCLEYLHNGSLQKHLSDECDGLDWHTRYKIIKGTCEGLKYLHEGYTIPIFHLDLKPDNILLDRNMVPKLADFGVSPFGRYQTSIIRGPVGTIGYMAPECIDYGVISAKGDMYSLGVVMIKIIAGPEGQKKCYELPRQEFIDQVQANWRKRLQTRWTGSWLDAYCEQVKICTEIALKCMEFDRAKRPRMSAVIHQLNEKETVIEELEKEEEPPLDKTTPPFSAWTLPRCRRAQASSGRRVCSCAASPSTGARGTSGRRGGRPRRRSGARPAAPDPGLQFVHLHIAHAAHAREEGVVVVTVRPRCMQ